MLSQSIEYFVRIDRKARVRTQNMNFDKGILKLLMHGLTMLTIC